MHELYWWRGDNVLYRYMQAKQIILHVLVAKDQLSNGVVIYRL